MTCIKMICPCKGLSDIDEIPYQITSAIPLSLMERVRKKSDKMERPAAYPNQVFTMRKSVTLGLLLTVNGWSILTLQSFRSVLRTPM
ncbi:uncharacterized protein FOMMEDRAFT_143037 [Fomitiporia mediterranea MF3/22]|uniref:uncharacterized protein n=1 Tax=Fomitiporia mediterranea (strain MF3/22) TaxID=694068 RepID=UPI0004407814|nr:uncharacterized protein FOMMEDRAFT_143037 [Fomitiporia mediterranea MF3/22]EJC98566.1 hypothetical protein FOMMEDRAFT_143037 [Fomitiporia mediterranea MF3/22]